MSSPPSLPQLRGDELRRKLAGMTDPLASVPGSTEKVEIKDAAIRFCSILSSLFGDDLDQKSKWDRIGTAISTACAKVSDDDADCFVSHCLDHIKAEDAQVARCEALSQLLTTFPQRTPEWRQAYLDYFRSHRHAVLVHGRARWEQVKAKAVEL
jgi:hypothetical protein